MLLVPAGAFWRGCKAPEDPSCGKDETPGAEIYLDPFLVDRLEVSVRQYAECVKAGACKSDKTDGYEWQGRPFAKSKRCNIGKPDRLDHPANCVDWYDAESYCRWAGKRLPTEAEWEKACRGTDGGIHPWGRATPGCDRAVINASGSWGCGQNAPSPVGSKPSGASPYGGLDMIGNVAEWVADGYEPTWYEHASDRNPQGPPGNASRVYRGGGWSDDGMKDYRCSKRSGNAPETRYYNIGFRCAKDAGLL